MWLAGKLLQHAQDSLHVDEAQLLQFDDGVVEAVDGVEEFLQGAHALERELPLRAIGPRACLQCGQRFPHRADGAVELAVLALLEDRADGGVEIGFGFVIILAVAKLAGAVHQSDARQTADLGADGALGQPRLLDEFVQRERGGGQVQHAEDRAHALGESPKAADLAQAFDEVLLDGFKFWGHKFLVYYV